MSETAIPAQAVEAAAKVIYSDGWDGAPYWESMADDNSDKIHHHAIALRALEAAAPHMQGESREMALIARERKRKLDAVTSIAARLGESMQGDDRELSEELYAAMGLD